MKRADPQISKKPYKSPTLLEYGSIREITQNVGALGNDDGGAKGNIKTHG